MGFIQARVSAGLSVRKVMEAIGVSDAAIYMWETGQTKPRTSLLPVIAKLYGCTIEVLLEPGAARDSA